MPKSPEYVKSERLILRVTKGEKAQLDQYLTEHPGMDTSLLLRTMIYSHPGYPFTPTL
jgi:hypothetical protein